MKSKHFAVSSLVISNNCFHFFTQCNENWTMNIMHCVKIKKEKHVEPVLLISKKICVEVILIFLLWITFSFPDFNEALSRDIAVFSKLFYRLICKNKYVEFSYDSKYIKSSTIGTEKKNVRI